MLVIASLTGTWGQAPGDETQVCVTGTAAKTYPDNWRLLLDNWNYRNLLGVQSAVWTVDDDDNNNVNNINTPTNVRNTCKHLGAK